MTEQDLILRVTRAAVRDHAERDPYAFYQVFPYEGQSQVEAAKDRMYALREYRQYGRSYFSEQVRRTVADALRTAQVLGKSADIEPVYHSYDDGIVIRVTYAETWLADYEVSPTGKAVCWQD